MYHNYVYLLIFQKGGFGKRKRKNRGKYTTVPWKCPTWWAALSHPQPPLCCCCPSGPCSTRTWAIGGPTVPGAPNRGGSQCCREQARHSHEFDRWASALFIMWDDWLPVINGWGRPLLLLLSIDSTGHLVPLGGRE